MVKNHFRWDFIGLSTDTKPTPETSEKVVDGSTYYTSDDSKLYVWYKDQWYEKEVTGGGGGGGSYTAGDGIVIDNNEISVDLAQSTGTSTTSVMSQNATSSMVFDDPATRANIKIGSNISTLVPQGSVAVGERVSCRGNSVAIGSQAIAGSTDSIAIGAQASLGSTNCVAIGKSAYGGNRSGSTAIGSNASVGVVHPGSVALGSYASCTRGGEVYIGTTNTDYGYNSTNYRVLGGLHDPVDAHDAATKGYVDANAGGGAKELTSADYDYPDANPRGVALWRLPAGMYWTKQGVRVFYSTSENSNSGETLIVSNSDYNALVDILRIYSAGGYGTYRVFKTGKNDGSENNTFSSKDLLYSELVYADTINRTKIQIGDGAKASGQQSMAFGLNAQATAKSTISFGALSDTQGIMNVGTHGSGNGYSSTDYRLITGVHDGQTAHDAVTVEQVNATIDAINTALSTNIPHIGVTS